MFQHTCTACNAITVHKNKWNITRKKYPNLCNKCAQACKKTSDIPRTAKNWQAVYNDPTLTGNTLHSARLDGLAYYKHKCVTHGEMPYAVLDNSCRKCTNEQQKQRNTSNASFNRPRITFLSAKRRAKLKGIPFELDLDDIRALIPELCPVFGIPLSYDSDTDTSPSLDRLDSSKGYTVENTRIISTRANRIKNNATASELRMVYEWMCREGLE